MLTSVSMGTMLTATAAPTLVPPSLPDPPPPPPLLLLSRSDAPPAMFWTPTLCRAVMSTSPLPAVTVAPSAMEASVSLS